ncbi:helix-turn-helix domain-containing protein [Flavisphingomonas formosensis]|uniref:helix-turn-helix domain-containing protein n=1 Tax=Flavisphingomonas formosensis TaxID=861534 RepID=UPI0012F71DB8|nr:helix-turn-helix transcriptional regulator [Sphingomonas formosensis]
MNHPRPGATSLLTQLRAELRRAGLTAKAIGDRLGVAEPTVRRWLNGQGLTLDRLDALCALAGTDIRDLAAAAPSGGATRFTLAQERILAADRALAFLFFAILNGWQPDAFEREFGVPQPRVAAYLQRLDRLGLIAIGAGGRVRPLTDRAVSWQRGGPLAVAFDRTVKHLFLTLDYGAEDARYVADMVRLGEGGRARVQALFEALRLEIHRIAEQERMTPSEPADWTALFLLVRPLDMAEVGEGMAA